MERPGKLIAIDGKHGDDIQTVSESLRENILIEGYGCIISEWSSSKLFQELGNDLNYKDLTPRVLALLHASDLAYRLNKEINPALEAGFYVLVNEYVHTPIAVALALEVELGWLSNLFSLAPKPDMSLCLEPHPSTDARRRDEKAMSYYEFSLQLLRAKNADYNLALFEKRTDIYFRLIGSELNAVSVSSDSPGALQKDLLLPIHQHGDGASATRAILCGNGGET